MPIFESSDNADRPSTSRRVGFRFALGAFSITFVGTFALYWLASGGIAGDKPLHEFATAAFYRASAATVIFILWITLFPTQTSGAPLHSRMSYRSYLLRAFVFSLAASVAFVWSLAGADFARHSWAQRAVPVLFLTIPSTLVLLAKRKSVLNENR